MSTLTSAQQLDNLQTRRFAFELYRRKAGAHKKSRTAPRTKASSSNSYRLGEILADPSQHSHKKTEQNKVSEDESMHDFDELMLAAMFTAVLRTSGAVYCCALASTFFLVS